MGFSPYVRQILVALVPQLSALSMGGSVGFPNVLLNQLSSPESSIRPDFDTITWLASMHGIAGIGSLLMPSLMQKIGRKRSFILSCLLLITGWSLVFSATNTAMLMSGECLLGFACNSIVVVNLMTVSEMLAPRYRTISMMLLGITQAVGIIFVTSVGTFLSWRILAMIMCVPVVIALLMVLIWPESPPWLAYRGNYGECEKAFIWLRGNDLESKKELQELITAQKKLNKKSTERTVLTDFFSKLKRRDFYIPIMLMLLLFFNVYCTGSICLFIYGKYVMEKATGDENASTIGFLVIDASMLVGAIVSLFLIKYFNSRTVLYLGSLRVVFLVGCSLVLYLQEFDLLSKSPWIFISSFEGSMVFFWLGLNTITYALAVELMPVKHRGVSGALYVIFTCCLLFVTNKILPYLIIWIGLKNTLLVFAANGAVCQFLIWKYMPETKNRTLQEIENYYNNGGYFNTAVDIEDNVPIFEENVGEP